MLELILFRHARSETFSTSITDFDRDLVDSGIQDTNKVCSYLATKIDTPDRIISSPAKRALATADIIATALQYPEDAIETQAEIYEASLKNLQEIIDTFRMKDKRILLVGHNPGFSELSTYLAGNAMALPTAAVAGFRFNLSTWKAICQNSGQCFLFDLPEI